MLPFDRLVEAVDHWASGELSAQVFMQIGDGRYKPRFAKSVRMLPMSQFKETLQSCELFIAHVGVGSILQALEARKRMLLLPRLASLGEHTTEHQMHTASKFRDMPGITIADNVAALTDLISQALRSGPRSFPDIESVAQQRLIYQVRGFLT